MGMFLRRGPAPHRTRMSDLEIGRSIKLNLNGTPWDWLVVHQGLPSSIYDASCDGTWLLMEDIYEQRSWDSANTNKLESSTIRSYLNSDFLSLFDHNIQSAIKQVKIPYRQNGGTNGTDQSGANGLSVKAFLLSGYEVGFTTSDSIYFPVDGAKLDYFTASSEASSSASQTSMARPMAGGSAPRTAVTHSACGTSTPPEAEIDSPHILHTVCDPQSFSPVT